MSDEPQLTLMAVHAHPDDEVITTGGVLARAAAEGLRSILVCATRGEVGEIHHPELDPEEARPQLGEIREEELRRACQILGVTDLYFLGYRDSGMVGTPENDDPRAFHNADPEEATGRLVEIMRRTRPDVVVTYNEKGGYGHPDHIAAHDITARAVEAAADPSRFREAGAPWRVSKVYHSAWTRSGIRRFEAVLEEAGQPPALDNDFVELFGVDDEDVTTVVDIHPYIEKKREALRVHATQIPVDDPFMALSDESFRASMGEEIFVRVSSTVEVPDREDDLFAGLR